MKKKVWLVLLAAVLVFVLVVSCGSSGSDGDRAPVKAKLKIPTEIELEENLYGDGYQAFLLVPLEKGDRVIAGDEWSISIKYKVDRNVPDGIQIGLVDRETNYWNPLSYDGDAKKGEPNAIFQTEALVAGTEYTLNTALVALKSAPQTGGRYNSVVFQTEKEYTRPSGDSGKHTSAADDPGPVTITVTEGGVESSNPFAKYVAHTYTYNEGTIEGTNNKMLQFAGVNENFSKFKASKYLIIVSKGASGDKQNASGFSAIQVAFNGSSDTSDWAQTDLGGASDSGWIGVTHTATDVVCFVVELSKLNKYALWLTSPWGQLSIGFYPDVQKLGVEAVLVVKEEAEEVFNTLTDKVVIGNGSSTTYGFATKSIDVTDLY